MESSRSSLIIFALIAALLALGGYAAYNVHQKMNYPIASITINTPTGGCEQRTYRVPPEQLPNLKNWVMTTEQKPLEVRPTTC